MLFLGAMIREIVSFRTRMIALAVDLLRNHRSLASGLEAGLTRRNRDIMHLACTLMLPLRTPSFERKLWNARPWLYLGEADVWKQSSMLQPFFEMDKL